MIPPFSIPIYESPAYVLSGLTFPQLPLNTQRYLLDTAKLVPPHAPHLNTIEREYRVICNALVSSLVENNKALVASRLEALVMAYDFQRENPPQPSAEWHETMQERRLRTVFDVLLPERELIFNAFMVKFDALVWLDQERYEDYTPGDWQRYRDALLEPILDYTNRQLVVLEERVINRPESHESHSLALPNPPYSLVSSYRQNTNRARSRTFATRRPDSRGVWSRGRRLNRHS